ncbi:hypothetical protein [Nocardia asteroides]|uniref:hypothetical protein n=1 Tax=Nocardia asteroides TaxID=1824 RepID=UPI001E4E7D17|nr:hypothetical protein [Nocardia asteroides]UGT58839.1 hypothetical protein LTT85_33345 [Nocardia asteroides]
MTETTINDAEQSRAHAVLDSTREVIELSAEAIFGEVTEMLGPIFEQMSWCEEEIAAAQARHPERADEIWHSFRLLQPTNDLMAREPVYRAHCREILDRVATGGDTRSATAIEVLMVMRETSLIAPLTTAATGLYFRMWKAAGLPDIDPEGHAAADLTHYEAIAGAQIDEHETEVRRRIRREDRIAEKNITCCGMHNGEPVQCRFAAAEPEEHAPEPVGSLPDGPAEQLALL